MVDFASVYNPLIRQNQEAASNPLGQFGQMVNAQNAVLQNKLMQTNVDNASLENAQNHLSFVLSKYAPALAKGDGVTHQDINDAMSAALMDGKGAISPEEISHFASRVPQTTDGAVLHKFLQAQQLSLMGAQQRLEFMRGQPVQYDSGGNLLLGSRSNFDNSYTPQATIRKGLTPEGAVQPQPGPPTSSGAPTTITSGERAEQSGLAAPGTYTGNGGAIPVTVSRNGQIMRRPIPQGGNGVSFKDPVATGSGVAMGSGPMPTGVSPAQGVALKASGDQYASARENAGTYAQQMQQLQSALTDLQNTNTGPGTESRQAIASYMLALPGGIGAYLPGVDPKSIAAYDGANKYLTQTAQGTPNASRSDAGLNTALASSPSVHISNAAAQDVLKANIGFRRFEMSQVPAFQKTGQDEGKFADWLAQRNQQVDPRAYSIDLLSPSQRRDFMSGLSGAARTKFLNSVRSAIAEGQVDPASLSNGGASGR